MYELISRKALLERLASEYKDTVRLIQNGETHLDSLAEGFTEVHNLIRSAPAVEAEPVRHGRWILLDETRNGVCDQCHRQDHIDPLATHCRYCGAKMDLA